MKYLFKVLTNPTCWFRSYKISPEWDKKLNSELDNPDFTCLEKHSVKLNGQKVWIANHPYASCSPYPGQDTINILPKRTTIFRFFDALTYTDLYKNAEYVRSGQAEIDGFLDTIK